MFLELNTGALSELVSNRHWSPTEVREQVARRVHRYRAHNLARGDRVMIHFGNQLEVFAEILAVWQLGGCVIPIDARLTRSEVNHLANAAKAKFSVINDTTDASTLTDLLNDVTLLHTSDHSAFAQNTKAVSGDAKLDDDALILFTSGSTGDPKGVVHTHRSLRARWITLHQVLGIEAYRRTLCMLPTNFGHGLICNCLFPWLFGCDLFLAPPFKPDLLLQLGRLIDEHNITFMSSVPSMWNLALRVAKSPTKGTLRRIQIGSAPLSADTWRQVQHWSQINEVINSYGITETGSWVAGTTGDKIVPEDGLIGVPWGATIQVINARSTADLSGEVRACVTDEPGMIWLNTPALMKGYFHRDDLTEAVIYQGWFMTGDIGVIDSRGQLVLRGRERDEINKGGIKVYPADIDAVVQQFEPVVDVCAFGINDQIYGENVAIALVLAEDEPAMIARLHQWIAEHLAEHKHPTQWYLLDEIPRTSRGKVNRDMVQQVCSQQPPLNLNETLRGKTLP